MNSKVVYNDLMSSNMSLNKTLKVSYFDLSGITMCVLSSAQLSSSLFHFQSGSKLSDSSPQIINHRQFYAMSLKYQIGLNFTSSFQVVHLAQALIFQIKFNLLISLMIQQRKKGLKENVKIVAFGWF